jgi:Response regulator of the LytR/AlgR family
MIRAVIIDEKESFRRVFVARVQTHFGNQIKYLAEADCMDKGIALIQKLKPELVFLATSFQNNTGFELLSNCSFQNFDVIFLSENKEDAVKAIRVRALDYLVFPIDDHELKNAMQRTIGYFDEKRDRQLEKLFEMSGRYFQKIQRRRITIKTVDIVYAIYEDDIIYCQSDGSYTTIYTRQLDKIIVAKSIKKIEAMLSQEDFIRCHQSYVVNKKHVLRYNKQGMLIFPLDVQVPVSNRRKEMALKRIFD